MSCFKNGQEKLFFPLNAGPIKYLLLVILRHH